jgi:quinol-cytochrome oxidoreductase complex cytochrome b subunit
MKKQKSSFMFRLLAAAGVLLFFFIDQNSDNEDMKTPILIMIAGIFICGFIALIWHGVKEWKKTDEEILTGFSPIARMISLNNIRAKEGFLHLLGILAVVAYALYNAWGNPAFTGLCVFFGITLSIICIPMFYERRREQAARSNTPPKETLITGEQLAAIFLGLVTCGFMCFFIGIGTYHGAWWFVLPPGSIFLFIFSRPLVAGVRTILLHRKDNGEQHVRKGREIDPWDRPDREC